MAVAATGVPRDRSGVSGPSESADPHPVVRAGSVPRDRWRTECMNQVQTSGGLSLSGRESGTSGAITFFRCFC